MYSLIYQFYSQYKSLFILNMAILLVITIMTRKNLNYPMRSNNNYIKDRLNKQH